MIDTEPGALFRHYGFAERPVCVGVFLDMTNEELRATAEILSAEAREARDSEAWPVSDALERIIEMMLGKAAAMDREAAG